MTVIRRRRSSAFGVIFHLTHASTNHLVLVSEPTTARIVSSIFLQQMITTVSRRDLVWMIMIGPIARKCADHELRDITSKEAGRALVLFDVNQLVQERSNLRQVAGIDRTQSARGRQADMLSQCNSINYFENRSKGKIAGIAAIYRYSADSSHVWHMPINPIRQTIREFDAST